MHIQLHLLLVYIMHYILYVYISWCFAVSFTVTENCIFLWNHCRWNWLMFEVKYTEYSSFLFYICCFYADIYFLIANIPWQKIPCVAMTNMLTCKIRVFWQKLYSTACHYYVIMAKWKQNMRGERRVCSRFNSRVVSCVHRTIIWSYLSFCFGRRVL